MIKSTKLWYALYTRAGSEKKVANQLSRKNIENYCPLKRSALSQRKLVLEPLFNSLVFIYVNETEIETICKNDHIVNVVYWLGKPAVIRNEEIDIMKGFLNEYANVRLQKIPFTSNGMLRTVGEPPVGHKTHIVSVKNNTVKIVLSSLGYTIIAEVENNATVEIFETAAPSLNMRSNHSYAN